MTPVGSSTIAMCPEPAQAAEGGSSRQPPSAGWWAPGGPGAGAEPPGVHQEQIVVASGAAPEGALARLVVERPDGSIDVAWLAWQGVPDFATVEILARLQLFCRRGGGRLRLEEVSDRLAELLELSGLRRELEG
ncbi:MAG TPA: hypothetical protein VMF65_09055 [Acidimicrobiales bacterium]|nr:hypothetical protein [Acidimicrobiales bacterium]